MPQLCYDAVIATRNRPEALALSLPALIGQSRPPARLIVIDASDDHAAVRRAVAQATAGWPGEVIVEHTAPGLTRQRNRGLALVRAPVVFFPDDDSIYFPDAAAEMMAVYERDRRGQIAAVCAAAAEHAPPGLNLAAPGAAAAASPARRAAQWLRRRMERLVPALKPALLLGRTLNLRHAQPEWLARRDVVPVEYMTGFRMSFRTEAIRTEGFDEVLQDYALDEDVDASFTAMRSGLVVGALRARVYHHRWANGRGDAFSRGRMEVLNRAYVLLKHAGGPQGSAALTSAVWRWHLAFTALKLLSSLPQMHRAEGRARFAGALTGHALARRLWSMPVHDRARILPLARV